MHKTEFINFLQANMAAKLKMKLEIVIKSTYTQRLDAVLDPAFIFWPFYFPPCLATVMQRSGIL